MNHVNRNDPHHAISWRYFAFVIILVAMFGYLASGLVRLQLINSEEYTEKVEDVVAVGDRVRVKFLGIDEKGRSNLSMKDAAPADAE